jgi:cell division protein FtsI (penicillin-binding protein 3)
MSATAIQTVAAMAAIANGGILLRPYLVQKILAPDGTVVVSRGREEVRRVLKEETAREITAMLEEVVEKGTGTRAALQGHRAAGKTGTAQKVDPVRGGYGDKRLSSFLGFAPADAPRVAILVAIDEPEGKGAEVTGGTVAAPPWGAIADEALRQLDVMPEESKRTAPLLVASLGPEGASVAETIPDMAPVPLRAGQALVPDVSGLGARSAIRKLAQAELEPELRGSGRAVAQSPRAGAIVKRGARVKVTLAPPG